MQRAVNVAVIGGGRMGMIRAAALQQSPNTQLSAIIDGDDASRTTLGNRFQTPTFRSVEELLGSNASPAVDAIWIATPTPSHQDLITSAAQAQKHVAVEKPVAETIESSDRCYQVCEDHNVHLHCCFQRRFDSPYVKMAQAVHAGNLGDIATIHAVFRDHPVPPIEFLITGGDIFHDLMVHDMDFIRVLTKDEPVRVFASGTSFNEDLKAHGIFDFATIMISLSSGTNVTMELSRHSAYGYDQRMECFGSNGRRFAVTNPLESSWEMSNEAGTATGLLEHSFPQRFDKAFAAEVDFFARLVRGEAQPVVSASDAAAVTRIAEAARQSALTGQVIDIPLPSAAAMEAQAHSATATATAV